MRGGLLICVLVGCYVTSVLDRVCKWVGFMFAIVVVGYSVLVTCTAYGGVKCMVF